MAAFADLDWTRLDVWAIVSANGLATMEETRHSACRQWLDREAYEVDTLDCRAGLASAVPELGRMLRWEEQFGYSLGAEHRNLDALRDGFEFPPSPQGRVFEVLGAEIAWREDPQWLLGLAAIVQEHSLRQLALGHRFFGLFVIPEGSPLVGATVNENRISGPYWNPCREIHDFKR
jgi:hypothetical protein